MPDLDFQQLSTVQNQNMPKPTTIASAATVAPTTFLTFITGTTPIVNITPPVTGAHMLVFVFTNATPGAFSAAGNVQRAAAVIQNVATVLVYDPVSAKYWVGALA